MDPQHPRREAVAERIKAGTVEINDGIVATWGSADVLQGGMKASGMGRRNGKYGILRFTEPQSIVIQRLHGIHPPGTMTHELFTAVMTHSFKALAQAAAPVTISRRRPPWRRARRTRRRR